MRRVSIDVDATETRARWRAWRHRTLQHFASRRIDASMAPPHQSQALNEGHQTWVQSGYNGFQLSETTLEIVEAPGVEAVANALLFARSRGLSRTFLRGVGTRMVRSRGLW